MILNVAYLTRHSTGSEQNAAPPGEFFVEAIGKVIFHKSGANRINLLRIEKSAKIGPFLQTRSARGQRIREML
jgi:hypothetical protein